jgi:hypothetical protein
LFGLVGGGLFLVILALTLAVLRPDPVLEPTPPGRPDLRATIGENFLNRFIEQPAEGSVRVNVISNNQVEIIADTIIQGFGLNVPAQIVGRFEIELANQSLVIRLLDTQVQGIELPPELVDVFSSEIPLINQNLQMMTEQISQRLGIPITFTGLRTDENQIQIEVREAR